MHYPPKNLIPTDKAMRMISCYRATVDNNDDMPQTISGHIGWRDLKNYIEYIEKQVCQECNEQVVGVEYFFARYDNETDEEQSGQMTLVIFPTVLRRGKIVPVDLIHEGDHSNLVEVKELYANQTPYDANDNANPDDNDNANPDADEMVTFALTSEPQTSLAMNRGTMSPPRDPSI